MLACYLSMCNVLNRLFAQFACSGCFPSLSTVLLHSLHSLLELKYIIIRVHEHVSICIFMGYYETDSDIIIYMYVKV